jgi:hypothetical protein
VKPALPQPIPHDAINGQLIEGEGTVQGEHSSFLNSLLVLLDHIRDAPSGREQSSTGRRQSGQVPIRRSSTR